MANLNLSEFTEKLFVTDADHTFIWDTVGAISKRVSRNSWLNSGTLTSDAPVTISQTWNGTGSTVFKALVVNATTPGTTSSTSSLLLDLQVGGSSVVKINKLGQFVSGAGGQFLDMGGSDACLRNISSGRAASLWADECRIVGGPLVFSDSINVNISNISAGVALYKEAANTLALRNGAAAQTFRIYNTTDTGVTTYERAALGFSSNVFRIGTENLAGVTAPRDICLNAKTGNTQIAGDGTNSTLSFPASFGGSSSGTVGWTNGAFYVGSNVAASLRLITNGAERLAINSLGNVGIGTISPTSKLQVTGGDVEIETVTSGIIMKAAGTSTRYRITLNAGGTALVFTAI